MHIHSHEKNSSKTLKLTLGSSSNVTIPKHPADEDSESDGASKFDGIHGEGTMSLPNNDTKKIQLNFRMYEKLQKPYLVSHV